MLVTYEYFQNELNTRIRLGTKFHYDVLLSIVKNPKRYTGLFRVTNAKTKLIQNTTQSREIKFGDFMEFIITDYIAKMDYKNLAKSIGTDEDGAVLSADQVFQNDASIFLIEQKVRDDHDSTKKRGQYANFKKKYELLARTYPNNEIVACMWFIDEGLVKNKKYYMQQAEKDTSKVQKHILYGGQLFKKIFDRQDAWEEIVSYLERNKQERSNEILTIPDPDTSEEMLEALRMLKQEKPSLLRKLLSDNPTYELLRTELFPTGANLARLDD